eukprot:118277-Pelagomonas_calceolata.AAC.2
MPAAAVAAALMAPAAAEHAAAGRAGDVGPPAAAVAGAAGVAIEGLGFACLGPQSLYWADQQAGVQGSLMPLHVVVRGQAAQLGCGMRGMRTAPPALRGAPPVECRECIVYKKYMCMCVCVCVCV